MAEQHDREASGETKLFTFREIKDHTGPLTAHSPNYKGSMYNILVLWEDGTETWEALGVIKASDPITLAAYAKDNDLLETPGWKKLKKFA